MPRPQNMLDAIAEDLSNWIDEMASQLADGITAGGQAPFAAQVTEAQKLEYYRDQLFTPDGQPNLQGRQTQLTRLGPESFAQVFKAVIKAYPNLAIPTPPAGAAIPTNEPSTAGPMPMPPLPAGMGLPSSIGMPRGAGMLPQGDVGAPVPAGGPLS